MEESASTVVIAEDLPYSLAPYPKYSGTFLGFQHAAGAPIVLCSCARKAVGNCVCLRLSRPILLNARRSRRFVIDSFDFPADLVQTLMDAGAPHAE